MYTKEVKKKPLADTTISALKCPPHLQSDDILDSKILGGGLYLRVTANGNKTWRVRYKDPDTAKWKNAGLGSYPMVKGKLAREKATEFMQSLHDGTNNAKKAKMNKRFKEVALKWFEEESNYKGWSDGTKQRNMGQLINHVFPVMGDRQIARIRPQEWLELFRAIAQKKNSANKNIVETAERTRRHCQSIYDYAITMELATSNPIRNLHKQLETHREKENMAHLSEYELPALLGKIEQIPFDIVKIFFKILTRVFVRPSMLCNAPWAEFNLEKKVWTIPAHRMKKDRPLVIPLADGVIKLLLELKGITGASPFLFPSRDDINKPCTLQRFRKYIAQMGYKGEQTLHGFRHIATTKLSEYTGEDRFKFDERIIHFQLSHKKQGVKGVYNKAQYLHDRFELMNFYCNWIDSITPKP